MNILLTGGNRGIGLALVTLYAERGDTVHVTARDPKGAEALAALAKKHAHVHVHALDVTDEKAVRALASELSGVTFDRLINNAGIASPWESLEAFDAALAAKVFATNSTAPLVVTRAFLPQLSQSKDARVFHVSSRMGSIGDNTSGGAYAYRMSKAALNMASSCLALELKPKKIASIVLHPGWVQTDMGGSSAPLTVAESSTQLVALMDRIGISESGQFYAFDGTTLPF